ncbi:NAD(P)H-dependent oxidoreductase [Capnocytophaga canis]|uniref:NAD(P)H-dependent oxidoreductase n=1 Tax=Capnocytophaga canis TaxID=1848903 RepID=UPI0005897E2B|nr:NAD(P)H-dependent oxidoreductase [Capnocytophaga canis]CEN43101.1 Nitroreductase family protein [Capnocytophaga canis]
MKFIELAQNRYTTKAYNNKKIDQNLICELKEILRLSPSSINSQPWRFIIVSDEKTKRALADVSHFNKSKINEASHLVVFLGFKDLRKFEKQITDFLPEGAVNYYHQVLKPKGDEQVHIWLNKQVYISLGFFLSACASMNIDSTAMEGIQNEKYDEILQEEGYQTLFAVAIGYRHEDDANQPDRNPKLRLPLEQVVKEI